MSIDYNRWWIVKNDVFYEEVNEETREVVDDYIVFPGTTAQLEAARLSDLTEEQIVDVIMEQPGSWSIVYYSCRLGKVFIGRDVFGRQSLVLNLSCFIFGCRTKPATSGIWVEVPFGQVTVFSLKSGQNPVMYSYLEHYPEVNFFIELNHKAFPRKLSVVI